MKFGLIQVHLPKIEVQFVAWVHSIKNSNSSSGQVLFCCGKLQVQVRFTSKERSMFTNQLSRLLVPIHECTWYIPAVGHPEIDRVTSLLSFQESLGRYVFPYSENERENRKDGSNFEKWIPKKLQGATTTARWRVNFECGRPWKYAEHGGSPEAIWVSGLTSSRRHSSELQINGLFGYENERTPFQVES